MIISKFKRELNGDISEILLNTGEVMQNTKYLADLEEKTVTENGTYAPSTGKVGFSKVVVNVPSGSVTKLYAWGREDDTVITAPIFYSTSATPSAGDKLLTSTSESGIPSDINYQYYRVKALTDGVLTVEEKIDDTWSDYEYSGSIYEGVRFTDGDITL